jgi:hypothetical protein
MYFIVGNPETPEERGVADDSISATCALPFIFFLACSHAGLLASQ